MGFKPKKVCYLILRILAFAVLIVPVFLKTQDILTELSNSTFILLIFIGTTLLIIGDIFERKYQEQAEEFANKKFISLGDYLSEKDIVNTDDVMFDFYAANFPDKFITILEHFSNLEDIPFDYTYCNLSVNWLPTEEGYFGKGVWFSMTYGPGLDNQPETVVDYKTFFNFLISVSRVYIRLFSKDAKKVKKLLKIMKKKLKPYL
ncbi:ribonuclease toxin immunity protein CdiI [Domibacillus sp. DTU_2020_1001157_1_SI_ALB_TIR_016]|uniref:ribonuclease toxin immunity protein CdiI n=1 Tax=Domibacillus sp. DTU_2020_1001157_1_SI_ALB_TIR_016 TaxID=3077789 RepID=UPI0028E8850C|nr:ribonuclease toxin immunity protein CdiI [Domibacillus sp. DTU_2020_1001157_1_SI_ALB_TIR_016]WNS78756.1 ribonuclease toxin immunity protein CdiI [Domibacillus sp. DTU_2020_1001157_1_SI_ALB_TIR_016]